MSEQETKRSGGRGLIAVLLILSILVSIGGMGFLGWRVTDLLKQVQEQNAARTEMQEKLADSSAILAELQKQNEAYDTLLKKLVDSSGEDVAAEDDVVIAGEYTIRSTKQISDAYRSGDTSALSDRDKETLDLAKNVLEKVITDGMTDYEKEEAVYKWLTTKLTNDTGLLTVIPTTGDGVDNPYGVLKNHQAVCVGYATTFRLFMQMMGIECMVIHSSDRIHSWDLVNLDGDWYHVDCYMDSDNGNYANFNMNDQAAASGHEWNMDFFPAATGIKYSPALMNRHTIEDVYAIPAFVRDMIKNRETAASCTFEKKIDAQTEPTASAMMDRISEAIWNTNEFNVNNFDYQWNLDENGEYVLAVFVQTWDDNSGDEPADEPDVDWEKINEAVTDVFGEVDDSGEDGEWGVG